MLKKEADYDTFFEEIYYKYRNLMFYTARRMLKDTYAAEDAVSEAFIKIAKNLSKLSQLDEKQMSDYVYILTRNTVVDILRKRKCEIVSIEEVGEIPDAHSVDDVVFSEISYQKILQTIEQMDEMFKDPLKLYCFYDHTVEEIADIMGIKAHSEYYRIASAKKKLLEEIEKEGK